MWLGSLRICQKIDIFVARMLLLRGMKRINFGLLVNKRPTILHFRVGQLPDQLHRQNLIRRTCGNGLLRLLLVLRTLKPVGFPYGIGLGVIYLLIIILIRNHETVVFWVLLNDLGMGHLTLFQNILLAIVSTSRTPIAIME